MTVPAEQLPGLIERMIRIETKLDIANERHLDHEGRIRRLERSVWLAAGAAVAGGGILGSIVGPLIGQ